jgi:hypothetical protein
MKLAFSPTDLKKKSQISSFIKICPVGDQLFHTDGWTDRQTHMKLILAFHNFVNVPKKRGRVSKTDGKC